MNVKQDHLAALRLHRLQIKRDRAGKLQPFWSPSVPPGFVEVAFMVEGRYDVMVQLKFFKRLRVENVNGYAGLVLMAQRGLPCPPKRAYRKHRKHSRHIQ